MKANSPARQAIDQLAWEVFSLPVELTGAQFAVRGPNVLLGMGVVAQLVAPALRP